jgi:hypothetical protein
MTQDANSNNETILVDKKFLYWKELTCYIEIETQFSTNDFLTETSPGFQLKQNDVKAKQ